MKEKDREEEVAREEKGGKGKEEEGQGRSEEKEKKGRKGNRKGMVLEGNQPPGVPDLRNTHGTPVCGFH